MVVYIASAGGHLDQWDGVESFLVTESMILKHTAKLDPTVPTIQDLNFHVRYTVYANKVLQTGKPYNESTMALEPVYTVRSLLISAVAVPFYYFGLVVSHSPLQVVAIFVNSMLTALTATIIFCFSLELYGSKKLSFILSLILGVCSFVWPYQNTLWAQPLQALMLIGGTYFIYKSSHNNLQFLCFFLKHPHEKTKGVIFAAIGGFLAGGSVLAHPTSLVLIPAFAFYAFQLLRHNRGYIIIFFVFLIILLGFVGVLNYLRFGSFTEFGYGYYGSLARHDGWKGLIGLLISPGSGILIFFPLAILLPLAARYLYKYNKSLFYLCSYVIIVTILDVGTLSFNFEPYSWWGTGWGPRYLVPILPFSVIMLGSIFNHLRKSMKTVFAGLAILGFFINLVGALVWWELDVVYLVEKEIPYSKDIWNTIIWDPFYSPVVSNSKIVLTNYLSTVALQKYANTAWDFVTYANIPCSVDVYIYCKYGIIPVIGLGLLTATIFVLVNNDIGLIKRLTINASDNKRKDILKDNT